MNQPIRKRRRRRRLGDSDPVDLSLISRTETEAGTSAEPTNTESKNDPSPPTRPETTETTETTPSPQNSDRDFIGQIRSEIQEDNYHSSLVEGAYWDDSHTWSSDNEFPSNDYWHFLGQYE